MRALRKDRFRPSLDGLERRQLLASAVVEVLNQSSYTITFDFRWTTSSSWSQVTERPGYGELFWTNYSTSLTPQVLYATTTSSGSDTTATLTKGYGDYTGTGTPPASSAVVYDFENTSTGVTLTGTGSTTPTDAVVDIFNPTSSAITFGLRWSTSSAWTQYTLPAGQSEVIDTTYSSTLTPQVEYYATASSTTETIASLSDGYGEWTGTGTPPASAATDYAFQSTSTGLKVVAGTGSGGGGSTTPPPNTGAVTDSNWSGYAAATNLSSPASNSVTYVAGSWVVPTVTGSGSGTTYSSVWVGIDGYNDSTVEQLGTEEDVVNGKPLYRAWWEMYSTGDGQPEQPISSMTISPGDSISAFVQYITSGSEAGKFLLSITDNSKANDSFSIDETSSQVQNPTAQRSSAEWIVEAPSVGNGIAKLANFGSVTFTNASATINGVTGPINSSSWHSQAINIGSGSTDEDTTSVLTNSGSSFVVTFDTNSPGGKPGVVVGGTIQAGGSDIKAAVLSLASGSAASGPKVILTGSAVPSGYRALFRPAQALEPSFVNL